MEKFNLILASASPRRKELLGHLKIPFEIITKNIPEESLATDPVDFSREIARAKGKAVLDDLLLNRKGEKFFVVSADTIVCLNGKIYGKPKDRAEAEKFLNELAGKSHSVFTAVVVHTNDEEFSFVEESKVTFNPITPPLMKRYLDTGDSLDKAGAYGIQGPSLTFISKVDGCYSNVVGFPLSRFTQEVVYFFKAQGLKEESWFDYFQC